MVSLHNNSLEISQNISENAQNLSNISIKSQKLKNESSISQANWSPSQANITFNTSSTVTPQKSKSETLLDVPVYSKYDLETDKAQITQSYERAVTKLQNQFNKEYNNIEYDIACAEIMISRLEAYESYSKESEELSESPASFDDEFSKFAALNPENSAKIANDLKNAEAELDTCQVAFIEKKKKLRANNTLLNSTIEQTKHEIEVLKVSSENCQLKIDNLEDEKKAIGVEHEKQINDLKRDSEAKMSAQNKQLKNLEFKIESIQKEISRNKSDTKKLEQMIESLM